MEGGGGGPGLRRGGGRRIYYFICCAHPQEGPAIRRLDSECLEEEEEEIILNRLSIMEEEFPTDLVLWRRSFRVNSSEDEMKQKKLLMFVASLAHLHGALKSEVEEAHVRRGGGGGGGGVCAQRLKGRSFNNQNSSFSASLLSKYNGEALLIFAASYESNTRW